MKVNRRYLVAVALLAIVAVVFSVVSTVAPPVSESISPTESLPSDSTGHFMNPPSFDSGWMDITNKAEQYFNITHNLNTNEVFVDLVGKQSLSGTDGEHQKNLGGTTLIPGWSQTYNRMDNHDGAYAVVQTGDGGYALAGYTFIDYPNVDIWFVKTDWTGNVQWNKTYGGIDYDYAESLVQTIDGGYALVGHTSSYGAGDSDFYLVKTDLVGNMQWNKTYWGAYNDRAYALVQTGDGGYALAGLTNSSGAGGNDCWLVKTDSSGDAQWNKTYGGPANDNAYSLVQTIDGGYALAGYFNYGTGNSDFGLIKTDSVGNMQWNKTYGGAYYDYIESLVETSDGGYVLAGRTDSYDGFDFWLVKTDIERGLAWTGLTNTTITLYRGKTDPYWNYVRVRIWVIKEPTWIYGDINQDGRVNYKDLYILATNYGKSVSLLSLSGIAFMAGIQTHKTRKKQHK